VRLIDEGCKQDRVSPKAIMVVQQEARQARPSSNVNLERREYGLVRRDQGLGAFSSIVSSTKLRGVEVNVTLGHAGRIVTVMILSASNGSTERDAPCAMRFRNLD